MLLVYLIFLVWIGYAVWFSYDISKDDKANVRWWTPLFYFCVGLWAAVLIVWDFLCEAKRAAGKALRSRGEKS
jgi:hypothetical protein